ncbi:MAG: tRNA (N6-isopentenyl adenosine(37)-C2)-methylthiotransferase MiaB [Anaerolineae bacterium]|nr:tRNA (N6-isopentenyl adenosine(37)-C2)-methylthiotransferase MiaB [Anaerolineae bacterium]
MGYAYYIWTIGCAMNVSDSQRLAAALDQLGYAPAARAEEADVVVLNTCVVRQQAEDKIYGRLGSLKPLKARRPEMVVGVMGCLVGLRNSEALSRRFPWVDLFLPPSDPRRLLDALAERGMADEGRAMVAAEVVRRCSIDAGFMLPLAEQGRLVSAYVPIVLGCSHACTYCIIPYRRGPERSRPMAEVLAESQALVAQGVKEITLLGQIVDRYGVEWGSDPALPAAGPLAKDELPLASLLRRMAGIERLERIRFSTSHPNWMSDDLLQAVAALPQACEHVEVPVQAGDDEVLARMRRGYTADDYRRLVARIRRLIPTVAITTDVIVGFPGETAAQFQRTYDLLAELCLDKVHVARYSPRPQTLAQRRYPDDVPPEEKERRRQALDDLQRDIAAEINRALLGKTVAVLVEGKKKGRWWGRTATNKLVFFEAEGEWLGQLVAVRINWTGPWSLIGELPAAGD